MRRILTAVSFAAMASAAIAQDGDAEAGKNFFKRCMACHVPDKPTNRVGPHLMGIVGRPVAGLSDFNYSEAMRAKGAEGAVWDEATLGTYLTDPRASMPGNKMAFAGIKKPADMANLIAYLKTLTE